MYFHCYVENFPCPPGEQALITPPSITDWATLGITPESVAFALAFGFGFILLCASVGFGVRVARNLIRQL